MKIEELLRPNVRKMIPYSSARDEFSGVGMVQLDANENPFDTGLNRYPDPYQRQLKKEIARYKGGRMQNLVLGNGSDELIDLAIRAFCVPAVDEIIGVKPSYGMYKVSCELNDVAYREIPLDEDFSLNADRLLREVTAKTKLIFICSPNNPSGNVFEDAAIEKLLNGFTGIVVLDEAYIDFTAKESWSKRLNEYPQLIVLQTFSKAIGLAATRLGMAWCSEQMVEIFNRIKPPYNINQLTEFEAMKRIQDADQIAEDIQSIIEQREWLIQELEKSGVVEKVYPSDANFILVKVNDANSLYGQLLQKNLVVRNRTTQYNCENCLRISVGTKEENKELIETIKKLENEESTIY